MTDLPLPSVPTNSSIGTVLVVDDDAMIRRLLHDCLEHEMGLRVIATGTALEAGRILAAQPVALLITDLMLDDASGVDVIRAAHAHQPDLVSILITGYPTVETAIEAMQLGVDDYLLKPFKVQHLIATVRRALERGRLRRDNMQLREQVAISELVRAIGSTLELDQLLGMVIETVRREFSAQAASILLRAGSRPGLQLQVMDGERGLAHNQAYLDFLGGTAPSVQTGLATGRTIVLSGQQTDMFDSDKREHDLICQPLVAKGSVIGVLNIIRKSDAGPCGEGTMRSIEITAAQAAIAIENSRLYKNVQCAYMDTVSALANAIETRDPYTRGHTDRVKVLAQAIARQMGWGVEQLFDLWIGCTLHDIGKIGVPDQILRKPGPLTPEEFAQMRRHPEIGATIIQGIPFLKPAVPYVYYHHERFDGKGYPTGLAGDKIPIEGRILAVVDTFDAVTSDRPYRQAGSLGDARHELVTCAGTQFDPTLVNSFLEILDTQKFPWIDSASSRNAARSRPATIPVENPLHSSAV
jgi:response regulator RpfG family c-di-GMP phosphodiesterase